MSIARRRREPGNRTKHSPVIDTGEGQQTGDGFVPDCRHRTVPCLMLCTEARTQRTVLCPRRTENRPLSPEACRAGGQHVPAVDAQPGRLVKALCVQIPAFLPPFTFSGMQRKPEIRNTCSGRVRFSVRSATIRSRWAQIRCGASPAGGSCGWHIARR